MAQEDREYCGVVWVCKLSRVTRLNLALATRFGVAELPGRCYHVRIGKEDLFVPRGKAKKTVEKPESSAQLIKTVKRRRS